MQELNSQLQTWIRLWVSSPGRSGGGAGKGRRACNYRYVRRTQRSHLWVIVKFYGWYHASPLFLYCKIGQTVIWSTYKPGNICVYMLWFNFIFGLNFIFLCFRLIIIHYHTPKQREIKFEQRINLNHNINITLTVWNVLVIVPISSKKLVQWSPKFKVAI